MHPSPHKFDFLVVGGGPAASICAIALTKAGANVCQVHRADGRQRGVELVSGSARRLLIEAVPAHSWEEVEALEITETISLWGDERPQTWSTMRSPYGAGIAVGRSSFDAALCRVAVTTGATLFGGHHAQSVERKARAWQLLAKGQHGWTELYGDQLVLATGRDARDLLGRQPMRGAKRLAYTALTIPAAGAARHTFHLEHVQQGWWYALPHPSGATFVGYCPEPTNAEHLGASMRIRFNRALEGTRLMQRLVHADQLLAGMHGRRAGMQRFERTCGENWIAIGDAAFAPDPLSGHGCQFAIASGLRAANTLLSDTGGAREAYNTAVQEFAARHHQQSTAYYAHAS